MALRTFRSNPNLGGFGSESTAPHILGSHTNANAEDCDAFAQIIKELVDNAVDACGTGITNKAPEKKKTKDTPAHKNKRVRVVIEQFVAPGASSKGGANKEVNDDNPNEREETDRAPAANEEERSKSDANEDTTEDSTELLRVVVSDNGCGMADIQSCVEAFKSSKAGNDQQMTAGRYGIGLTLCLLHAQRLVPNSCASITSATTGAKHFTKAQYVVDTEGDSVRCVDRNLLPKSNPEESGTSVSLLVPGGATARAAWPRLAEYFARFRLSLGIPCSLEVMAATLSKIPLLVRPPLEEQKRRMRVDRLQLGDAPTKDSQSSAESKDKTSEREDDDSASWRGAFDDLDHDDDDDERTGGSQESLATPKQKSRSQGDTGKVVAVVTGETKALKVTKKELEEQRRRDIHRAVELYLGHPVDLENVAHSRQPIRSGTPTKKSKRSGQWEGPCLEVDFIVCGEVETEADEESSEADRQEALADASATMILVRMVNRIPLLDGAEASSCGLVQGLLRKKKMWNSFGLEVNSSGLMPLPDDSGQEGDTSHPPSMPPQLPTFQVRDSDQVAPFMKSANHSLFEDDPFLDRYADGSEEEKEEADSDNDIDAEDLFRNGRAARKRRKQRNRKWLLPAHVRLGKVLVIAQIDAEPSSLPLPTLSKGRLPSDNVAIGKALEVGMLECLRCFQKSNPSLLLTAPQLKRAERDARYVPAVAASIGSIVAKSSNPRFQKNMVRLIQRWENTEADREEADAGGGEASDALSEEADENSRDKVAEEPLSSPTSGFRDQDNPPEPNENRSIKDGDEDSDAPGATGGEGQHERGEGDGMENQTAVSPRDIQKLARELGENVETRLRLVMATHEEGSEKKENKKTKKKEAEEEPKDSSPAKPSQKRRKKTKDDDGDDQSEASAKSCVSFDFSAVSEDSTSQRSTESQRQPAPSDSASELGDYDETSMGSLGFSESSSPPRAQVYESVENDDDWWPE